MTKKFGEYIRKIKELRIVSVCKKCGIENYYINPDLSVDVIDHVYLGGKNLKSIPLIFNRIEGNFYIDDNELTTLEGCPKYVSGDFIIRNNKLTTLKGCPEVIGGPHFQFSDNNLYTLEGAPRTYSRITLFHNPIEEIITLFYKMDNLLGINERILEAWNLYNPVYYKDEKWYVYEYRLRELHIDVVGKEYVREFPKFENYILDKT